MKSLREALNGHHNSLGVIRLVLASLVIFDHAFPLGGWGEAPFLAHTRNQQSLGGLAVLGFFAISGYLVTKSGMNIDVVQFVWRRFLRIFPGFWLALLAGGFVVGPFIWLADGRSLGTYFGFGPGSPWAYFYENFTLTIRQWDVLDVFASTPFGGSMNGSIWTLTYEWGCYILLAGLVLFGVLKKAKIIVPMLAALFFIMQVLTLAVPQTVGSISPYFGNLWNVNFGLIFFIGGCLALYSEKIPFDNRLGIFAGVISIVFLRIGGFNTMGYVAFAYFVLYLAARLPRQLHWIGAKNDYSYGVYLYGWVAAQILAHFGVQKLGYFPFAFIALVCAAGLAWISWHLVEKQALKLKDWGPGRGVHNWSSWASMHIRRLIERREAARADRMKKRRPVPAEPV